MVNQFACKVNTGTARAFRAAKISVFLIHIKLTGNHFVDRLVNQANFDHSEPASQMWTFTALSCVTLQCVECLFFTGPSGTMIGLYHLSVVLYNILIG